MPRRLTEEEAYEELLEVKHYDEYLALEGRREELEDENDWLDRSTWIEPEEAHWTEMRFYDAVRTIQE